MLKGEKIILKAISLDSLEQLMNWRNQPEIRKYSREHRQINLEMQNRWYQEKVLNDDSQINFEIREGARDRLVGHCSLGNIDWVHRHAEFGIYIGDLDYHGGGYASDALRTLIEYGFNTLNLNKIWGEVHGYNNAIDKFKHIGFKEDGVLREHHYSDGNFHDSRIVSILREEYEKN